jgi:beta-glucanase (GH16 family)
MLNEKSSQKLNEPSETDMSATVGTFKKRYNLSSKQLLIFALVFAVMGSYLIFRSFAATATLTKVWDSNADWSAGILSNTTVNNGSVSLAPATAPSGVASTTASTNLALNRPATASSTKQSGTGQNLPASAAFDGNSSTRWGSQYSDPQWVYVDLGAPYNISHVKLSWETAYAKAYQIQVSNDARTWTTIYSTTSGTGSVNDLTNLSGTGRYVRMYGTQRATQWGYSLYEMAAYGTPASTSGTNLALNKPATASSTKPSGSQNLPASAAFDGNLSTRWGSQYSDPQWIYVDLGSTYNVNEVNLTWETAYAKAYQIQVSNDAQNWTTIYSTTNATGGVNDLKNLSGTGRYVRMNGTQRGTQWGYSLYEMAVYGTPASANVPTTYVPSGTVTLNYDAATSVTWKSLTAQTTLPAGTKITYQARSSADNVTWSAWNSDVTLVPKNRYIQIQATLSATDTSLTPLLNSLTLSYDSTITTPTVSLTSPANGVTVSGTANLAADATDAAGVTKVEFYVNNSLIGADTSSPYSLAWDTSSTTNGSYALTAKAYNASGGVGTSGAVNVTINNAPPSTGGTVPTGPSPYTNLVWSDEFNGAANTLPDPAKWTIITGTGGCTGYGNNELETYTNRTSNLALDGQGALDLIARQETYTASDGCARNYTSGRIETRNKYTFTYGHMESRVWTPAGKGLWPAFWSFGNSWPNGGEIDAMEELNSDTHTLHANIHGPTTSGSAYAFGTSYNSPNALMGSYHVYSVTWQPDSVSWQLDGQQYFSVSRSQIPSSYKWVFDQPEWMVLNLAVGGGWPGSPDSTTPWPSTMKVDWVRVFQ